MNILILNAHEHYEFSQGKLNKTFVDLAKIALEAKGHTVKVTETDSKNDYDVAEEIEKHKWADAIILQSPVNWMGVPWSFKKYMDVVYTAGMMGDLCAGDGRHRDQPEAQYGTGGLLKDTKFMLSVTFNAPKNAFNDKDQWFFEGISVDDLFNPIFLNYRFFGMDKVLPTFVAYDVMKNPQIEQDIEDFKAHIEANF